MRQSRVRRPAVRVTLGAGGEMGQVQAGRHRHRLRRRVPGGRDAARRSRRVPL